MYISDKEHAQQIRNELKAAGYKASQFSITSKNSISIRIKDLTVNRHEVERIAYGHESISRDERTGDILSGGNRYVFVDFDMDARRAGAEPFKARAAEIIATFSHETGMRGYTIATDRDRRVIYWPNGTGAGSWAEVEYVHENSTRERRYIAESVQSLAEALAIITGQHKITI